jgi:hypothetical protein
VRHDEIASIRTDWETTTLQALRVDQIYFLSYPSRGRWLFRIRGILDYTDVALPGVAEIDTSRMEIEEISCC